MSKQEANPAISEKAIPLPPPESMIKLIKIDKPEFIEEKLLEKKDLNEDSSQKVFYFYFFISIILYFFLI